MSPLPDRYQKLGFSPPDPEEMKRADNKAAARDVGETLWKTAKALLLTLGIIVVVLGGLYSCMYTLGPNNSPRVKTAQACSDMRSLAMAIEYYMMDHNSYPAWTTDHNWAWNGDDRGAIPTARYPTFRLRHGTDMMSLTTPVAYLTSYLSDPFAKRKGLGYRYYAVGGDPTMSGVTSETAQMWILWCAGPDKSYQIDLPLLQRLARATPHQLTPAGLADFTYDPSNGTTSRGDVWRPHMP